VGSNRRYAASVDRAMDARIVARMMSEHAPDSLTDAELELDEQPITRTPRPERVTAWVRYGGTPVRVDGEAVAWTAAAVAVRWRTPGDQEHRAWVWASAVSRARDPSGRA
jgi:hypothetical protein